MTNKTFIDDLKKILSDKDIGTFRKAFNQIPSCNEYIINDGYDEVQINILHFLASYNDEPFSIRCIEMILNHDDIDINKTGMINGNYGLTAAHMAISNKNIKIFKLLIDNDCDLFQCDSYGKNVLDYANKEKIRFPEIGDIVRNSLNKWYDKQFKKDFVTKRKTTEPIPLRSILLQHPRVRFTSDSSTSSATSSNTVLLSAKNNLRSVSSNRENPSTVDIAGTPTDVVRKFWSKRDDEEKQRSVGKIHERSQSVTSKSIRSPVSDVFFTPQTSCDASFVSSPIPKPPPLPPNSFSSLISNSTPKRSSLFSSAKSECNLSKPISIKTAQHNNQNNIAQQSSSWNGDAGSPSSNEKWKMFKFLADKPDSEKDNWTSSQKYFHSVNMDETSTYSTPMMGSCTTENRSNKFTQMSGGKVKELRRQLFHE